MPRNQTGWRGSQNDWGRSNQYRNRDEDEGRYSSAEDDRNYDEGDSSVRGGMYDQGRGRSGQSSRRDINEQSGSTGRYAGYGDFGRGDYGGGGGYTGQDRYGQSGFGGGQYRGAGSPSGSDYGYSGSQGGYGGSGRGGSSDYPSGGSRAWRGHGIEGNYSRHEGQGRYGQGTFGTERGGWNEPYGEGQQYTSGGDYGGSQGYGSQGYGSQGYGGRSTGEHRGKGPKGYQRSDERLKEMLCERLRDDPEIDPSDVTITVSGGRITLDGTVDSRHTKNRIEDVAEQFGVQEVQNNLRVQKQSQSRTGSSSGATFSGGQSSEGEGQGRTVLSSSVGAGKGSGSSMSSEDTDQSSQSKQKRN